MRLSCVLGDPGYHAWLKYCRLMSHTVVLLNGSEIPEAITADEEAGEVVCYARDEWGELILSGPAHCDWSEHFEERRYGLVEIRLRQCPIE